MLKQEFTNIRIMLIAPALLAVFLGLGAHAGANSSGGGDQFIIDFIKTATQEIYPWLLQNSSKLNPKVDPSAFLVAVDPKDISSADKVYESCDGSIQGRETAACFNATTGKTLLSRSLYPLAAVNSPVKRGLIAHEIFRKMSLEGDAYEITKQISIAALPESMTHYLGQILTYECTTVTSSLVALNNQLALRGYGLRFEGYCASGGLSSNGLTYPNSVSVTLAITKPVEQVSSAYVAAIYTHSCPQVVGGMNVLNDMLGRANIPIVFTMACGEGGYGDNGVYYSNHVQMWMTVNSTISY